MPISMVNGQLLYFAHIPKCAGSSIEAYLHGRFGRLGMLDRAHFDRPRRWTRSSPQHALWKDMERLLPADFLSASFAVVRHPVERLKSVFTWQREWQETIPPNTSFVEFLDIIEKNRPAAKRRYPLDNHASPMTSFVPPDCTVFRLEDGLHAVVEWLDSLAGNTHGPRDIGVSNRTSAQLERKGKTVPKVALTSNDVLRIEQLYADDFRRFGYSFLGNEEQTT